MARKKTETENIETQVENAVISERWIPYYENNVNEDEDIIQTISETAIDAVWEKFHVKIEDHRMMTSIFLGIMETFMKKLVSLERDYDEFKINLADRLAIGFTNNENDDDEKSGNYMVFIEHLKETPKSEIVSDPTISNLERVVQWNAENVIQQPKLLREMALEAVKLLKELDIHIANSELIMPLFITYYEAIVVVSKTKRHELPEDEFELRINYIWFDVIVREGRDGRDDFLMKCNISSKLTLKNDQGATSRNE